MPETVTCDLEDLASVLDDEAERYVEEMRGRLTKAATHLQVQLEAQVPRYAGDLASSIQPYVGEPGPTWRRGGGGSDAGAAQVEAVMQEWEPGQEVGVATDAPYGRKILMHAGDRSARRRKQGRRGVGRKGGKLATFTKQVAAGWVDVIVAEANRELED